MSFVVRGARRISGSDRARCVDALACADRSVKHEGVGLKHRIRIVCLYEDFSNSGSRMTVVGVEKC